jgi:hypothetical protein
MGGSQSCEFPAMNYFEETTSGVLKQIFGFSSPLRPARSFGKLAG